MNTLAGAMPEHASEFDQWWSSPGDWVEPPNQRRGGESGVRLLQPSGHGQPPQYCKQQTGHIYRTLRYPFGRPTVLRELQAYEAISHLGITIPVVVYGAARRQHGRWQALLVTEALQGFVDLNQWYAANPSKALRDAMLSELAVTLTRLHRARWQHGCCYPKHIFVRVHNDNGDEPTVEVALLDLEKSRQRWRFGRAARRDLSQLERHRGNMPESDFEFLLQIYQSELKGVIEGVTL